MSNIIDKQRSGHPRNVHIEGQTLSLSSASPLADRRRAKEDSLLDSLLDPRQGYLFCHRRRQTPAAPEGSQS